MHGRIRLSMKIFLYCIVLLAVASFFLTERGAASVRDSTHLRHTETEAKVYKIRSVVIKIFREEKKITLTHTKIKGVMPAMTTTFPVSKLSILDEVKVGSKRTFTILVYKGLATVVGVRKHKNSKLGL